MAFYKCEGVKRKGADAPFLILWSCGIFLKPYKSYKPYKPYKPYKLHAPSLNLLLYRAIAVSRANFIIWVKEFWRSSADCSTWLTTSD